MKVIFLDFDGVLNSDLFFRTREKGATTEKNYHLSMIDIRCAELLDKLVSNTGAEVVVSSTWRLGHSVEYLQELLEEKGFSGNIIGKTPSIHVKGCSIPRGVEIDNWLRDQDSVTNYIILDDDSDMLLKHAKHYFRVDNYSGLTPNIVHRATRFLNNVIS